MVGLEEYDFGARNARSAIGNMPISIQRQIRQEWSPYVYTNDILSDLLTGWDDN